MRSLKARVTRIVQALNRATRTMTVEVDLPNKDHRLKGGMFARVEVLVGKHPHAIQIPLDAVSRLEESQYVYVVKDGKAHQVPVELGARAENRVEVVKGLAGRRATHRLRQRSGQRRRRLSKSQPMDAVKRES
jgi:multidrug efflux pump subunit AcrA (membrane-fusion protein)